MCNLKMNAAIAPFAVYPVCGVQLNCKRQQIQICVVIAVRIILIVASNKECTNLSMRRTHTIVLSLPSYYEQSILHTTDYVSIKCATVCRNARNLLFRKIK